MRRESSRRPRLTASRAIVLGVAALLLAACQTGKFGGPFVTYQVQRPAVHYGQVYQPRHGLYGHRFYSPYGYGYSPYRYGLRSRLGHSHRARRHHRFWSYGYPGRSAY